MRWTFHKMLKRDMALIECIFHPLANAECTYFSRKKVLDMSKFECVWCFKALRVVYEFNNKCSIIFVEWFSTIGTQKRNGWIDTPYFTICVLVKYTKITRITVDSLVIKD